MTCTHAALRRLRAAPSFSGLRLSTGTRICGQPPRMPLPISLHGGLGTEHQTLSYRPSEAVAKRPTTCLQGKLAIGVTNTSPAQRSTVGVARPPPPARRGAIAWTGRCIEAFRVPILRPAQRDRLGRRGSVRALDSRETWRTPRGVPQTLDLPCLLHTETNRVDVIHDPRIRSGAGAAR